jgi:hypothetical protein
VGTDLATWGRNQHTLVLRTGTIVSVSADGMTLTVEVAGEPISGVQTLTSLTAITPGTTVAILMDREIMLAIGNFA